MGLLRILLQNSPIGREAISWFIPACSLAVLLVSCLLLAVLSVIFTYCSVEYGLEGGGKGMHSWLDERILPKIIREFEKLEFEGKIGGKKNQSLLETSDKNERKNVFHAFFYFLMTWLPVNFLILFFIRLEKSIRNMIVRKYVLVKCFKHVVMHFINLCSRMLSSAREFL